MYEEYDDEDEEMDNYEQQIEGKVKSPDLGAGTSSKS